MSASSLVEIESLFNDNGKPEFGHLTAIPKYLDLERFVYRTTMDKTANRLAKYFHYKQFQFVSICTPDYIIGVAMADIRYLGNSFYYVYDIATNELVEAKTIQLLGYQYQMSPSPWQSASYFKALDTRFEIEEGLWHVRVTSELLDMDITLSPPSNGTGPLMLCTPTGYSGWTYTQKHNALDVTGRIVVKGNALDVSTCLAGYDFSAGYMRQETSWRWASINAWVNGRRIGVNVAAGVNETGATENTVWIDGQRYLLNGVHFDFDRLDSNKPWRIYGDDGGIDLTFQPLQSRSEKLNVGVLKSNFRQYVGYFSGVLTDLEGHRYPLDRVIGLTEDHYAKW
ncbi:DUF2804 domain-containing protein [Vibrio methylphosphonaticus]|uniref:DUF2804 domain-containing protein n=1 Tax=Vibrio methylphosphonaticus TaxID=2946866 RepID=UPI002029E09E|nr:DUF2804 domain-containing protein [Vibrio methylphosphonaticus]MCL9775867.1 DUF2804 domain-containing protein [Vibrio methylphosphonaticus]